MKHLNFNPTQPGIIERAIREAQYTLRPNKPEVVLINTVDLEILSDNAATLLGTRSKERLRHFCGLRMIPSAAIDPGTFEIF